MQHYFIRTGPLGDWIVGRASPTAAYERGTRVLCRTPRGLQVGEITATCDPVPDADRIVRATTTEDEWLINRLRRERCRAIEGCRQWLAEQGSSAVLLDVDQLFDSGAPLFYFLRPPDPDDTELIERLAEKFESHARTKHFAKQLADGCGPGCGTRDCGDATENAADNPPGSTARGGCSGTCAACVVARSGKP